MTNVALINEEKAPEYAYHLLRGALETFQKNVSELNGSQYKKAKSVADRTFALESIVLSTPEARDIVIADSKLDAAMNQVASRYSDRGSFIRDLENNGLDECCLRKALYRELLFDAVMDRVTTTIPDVSELDVQIFYQLHRDRFTRPERRKARHILITVNPDYPENDFASASRRINMIAEKLERNPGRFAILARKYSECPTAMDGGKLGELEKGTLYPELDSVLFSMHDGEISPVIETEMGLHIVLCEKISSSVTLPLSRARDRITRILQERRRKACQKAWLAKVQDEADDQ